MKTGKRAASTKKTSKGFVRIVVTDEALNRPEVMKATKALIRAMARGGREE